MRFIFALFIVFSSSLPACRSIHTKNLPKEKRYVLEDKSKFISVAGEISQPIVKLLGLNGIRIASENMNDEKNWPEAKLYLDSKKLDKVVAAIQGRIDPSINWLGDTRKERWESDSLKPQLSLYEAESILQICQDMLSLNAKKYPHSNPQAILFLGSTLLGVRERLAYLNELYDHQQLSPTIPIYILTGERSLDPSIGETKEKLLDSKNGVISFRSDYQPKDISVDDEGEMISQVFSQSRHKDLHEDRLRLVYSSKGTGRRATTESTLVQWLKEYVPPSGTYLAISNQPYVFYQESVINRVLQQQGRKDICVHVVGPQELPRPKNQEETIDKARNYLSLVSRILYELTMLKI